MKSPGSPAYYRPDILVGAFSLALAVFCFLSFVLRIFAPGFDGNQWWIDLRWLPGELPAMALLVGSATFLLAGALFPRISPWRRICVLGVVGILAAASAINVVQFYYLHFSGTIRSAVPIPFSLMICGGLLAVGRHFWERPSYRTKLNSGNWQVATLSSMALVLLPLLLVLCFGKTDYRRRADAIVVFGARAYANGEPSDALADRVRTGCELYRRGFASRLILSGGPGDGSVHETESMRALALRSGVKQEDILLDAEGLNTRATVKNTITLFKQQNIKTALAVSHFYHLPRIKMAYQQEGFEVWTVPASETYFLRQIPFSVLRETVALWVYYLDPIRHSKWPRFLSAPFRWPSKRLPAELVSRPTRQGLLISHAYFEATQSPAV